MLYFFSFLLGVGILFLLINSTKEINYTQLPHNNGRISKFEFEGHSYVGWTCNLGSGLVHDPDCICKK